jgi:PAS domain S-box-containing protein
VDYNQFKGIRPQDVGIGRLFDSVRDAVILADTRTQQIVLWNPGATDIFGYSTAEALGLRIEALVPEYLKHRHREGITHYAETGHGSYIDSHKLLELPALIKSGEEISIEMSLSPIREIPGLDERAFVLAIIRNITERKKAEKEIRRLNEGLEDRILERTRQLETALAQRKIVEERLREAEAKTRMVIERIPAVTYIREMASRSLTTYVSPQINALLGYDPEECISDPEHWIKILHPDDKERVLAEDSRTNETGEPFRMEYRQFAKDGSVVWVRDEATVVCDEEGKPSYWLGVLIDVTERKEAEADLKEANRRLNDLAVLKADFTAMVAHELDTPLAVIRGYAEMLTAGELESADQSRALDKIQAEAEVLSGLVADVRAAATVEQEDFAIDLQSVPVRALLDTAVQFSAVLPGNHSLVVENGAEEHVWADPKRIGQVLRNLLSNAAKYSPENLPIELRARRGDTPGRIRIEVVDHGHGIHPDDVQRVFEKFGRGRNGYGRKIAGTGLGLYLSRRIMQAHGSNLTLSSGPGDGSVFGFELEAAR